MDELIEQFSGYPEVHPFRRMVDTYFDTQGNPIVDNPLKYMMAMNYINHVRTALFHLRSVSECGYRDFITTKLRAQDKTTYNQHNLLSALCELAVMNSFITASEQPDSFQYEVELRSDNKSNVEFTVSIEGTEYAVEVKSGNMLKQYSDIDRELNDHGTSGNANIRILPIADLQKFNLMGSLDNKVKDFLVSSEKKFPEIDPNGKRKNLLFICWDECLDPVFLALLYKYQGLLTPNSFYRDENGPILFPHVQHILVSSLYQTMIKYVNGELCNRPFSPFEVFESQNWLIDHNLASLESDVECYRSILRNPGLCVVDGEYVTHNCSEFMFYFSI